ncbi:hypothetical protein Chor_005185 [Crotalus horridus]
MEKAVSNLSAIVPASRLTPAFPPAVKVGLTTLYTALYALLFFSVYAQLWLVLLYRHKKFSYQTVFLFLCLFWAALRTTLFSFYFRNTLKANRLHPFFFWLLYCCPVCLQFFTLTLMNLYFAQDKNNELVTISKPQEALSVNYDSGVASGLKMLGADCNLLLVRGVCFGASVLFLAVNVACAVLVRARQAEPWAVVLARVLISDSLFVLGAVSLALCLFLGTNLCQTAAMGGTIVLLYASRACYNLAALALSSRTRLDSFDYDWYNVSDQVNPRGRWWLESSWGGGAPASWTPSASRVFHRQLGVSRSYFFDYPGQRENEGLTSSLAGRSSCGSYYGSINRNGEHDWFGGHPPTAPLLFSQAAVSGSHHHSLYSTPQN